MKTVAITMAALGTVLLVSCSRTPQNTRASGEGFAIYLTARDVPPAQMDALSHVELAAEPFLSMADIVSYDWETHEVLLTEEGADKADGLQVPTSGRSFMVCVDGQPVYWGAFWAGYSSASFDGITIGVHPIMPGPHAISIGQGYPRRDFFKGEDPRSDPRILKSLEQSGKLAPLPTPE